ncbi:MULTISPECIES: hypothetical protein [Streptomyces]|uniref:hypothetical protein n=1 Tax=Streptomyces lycopersici TaxID=2974589 RepID=UPI0021CFF0B0|nr:hypothetical protein [Streptomyces sp. NEAU-383]
MAALLACLTMGTAVAGCADGATTENELSSKQMLDNANKAMKALKSVTIDTDIIVTDGDDASAHLTTNLKDRCASKTTWTTGARLEQIRIGGTDYLHRNRAYLERWSGQGAPAPKDQSRWVKASASEAEEGSGIAKCTWEFDSFGVATKGTPAKINGFPAIALVVTDEADKGGSYTFHIATRGKPYILKVVYRGADYHNTTSFSAFDKPMDVRPPAKTDILDASGTSH